MFKEGYDRDMKDSILSSACKGVEWENFLDSVEKSVNTRLAELQLKHLSELTDEAQAVLIENEIIKIQSAGRSANDYRALSLFTDKLEHDIDSMLIERLQDKSFNAGYSSGSSLSNADKLSALTCHELIRMMESSKLEIKNYLKLFVNRPLPKPLRKYLWHKTMNSESTTIFPTPETSLQRLIPTLDIMTTRRVFAVLERSFPEYSTSENIHLIKLVVSEFYRQRNLPLPSDLDESILMMDQCIYLLIPVLAAFSDSGINFIGDLCHKPTSYAASALSAKEDERKQMEEILLISLLQMTSGRFNADVRFSAHESLDSNATSIAERVMGTLIKKDQELALAVSQLNERSASASSRFLAGYLHHIVSRGLSGWVSLECVFYIWDQGFLFGFEKVVRFVVVSIFLGAKDEIKDVRTITHLKEALDAYARNLSISRLQSFLATYFMKEMKELFDMSDDFVTELSLRSAYADSAPASNELDDDILRSIFEQLKR